MKKHLIKNSVLRDFIKKHFWGFSLFFLGIIFSVLIIKINKNELKRLHKEYSDLLLKDSISYIVIKKYSFDEVIKIKISIIRDSPYTTFLKLSNNKKIYILTDVNKSNYKIDEIIEEGDSIVKHKGSDTIYVYKKYSDAKKYDCFFVINTVKY